MKHIFFCTVLFFALAVFGSAKKFEAKLAELAKDISAEAMEKYKSKRKEKLFPIMCKVNDKRCSFCGMDLPIVDVNRLTSGGMIECDSCHRIIYKE